MKKIERIYLSLILFLSFHFAYSQDLKKPLLYPDTTVYSFVDLWPVLITPEKEYENIEIQNFIRQNLKWPRTSMDCEGMTIISFIVEKDGGVTNRKYLKKLCSPFDEEAMKVISLMTKWKPGVWKGEIVRTKVVLPVRFTL